MTTSAQEQAGWVPYAACAGQPLDLFFGPHDNWNGNSKVPRGSRASLEKAKALCRSCPVRVECADAALPYGIWGGQTRAERVLESKRGRRRTAAAKST
jgi:WhiB family redox-sensing transcriptional regulator